MHVSVVIPTYNRRPLLARALRSVAKQTYPADETIVVDDGSTDGTADFVAAEFPWARLIQAEHRGVSAARNLGIRRARNDWIAFLDSDDEWLADKLAHQAGVVAQNPDHQLVHGDEIWVRRGRRVNPRKKHAKAGGRIFRLCLPLCTISPSAVVLHRRLLDQVGLFDESYPVCEDYDLWLRICAHHPVLYVDHPILIKYGGHDDQLSRRYWGMDRWRIRSLARMIDSGTLEAGDRAAAEAMLSQKALVYASGCRKRHRFEEGLRYERMASHYRRLCVEGFGSGPNESSVRVPS